ncbi:hypothetical protein MKW92_028389 [Papaver armeniacum]|nr:hypothetical protein MKW92_028389 [Papaver armeniacum]
MTTRNGEEEDHQHHTSIRLPPSSTATANNHHHPPNHSNRYYPTHNYPTHSTSSSRASFKGCCCCLFLLLTFLGLLVLAVILIIVLAVKPKKPQYELQQVSVQYVGIAAATSGGAISSNSIVPSASLSFNIKMIFTAVNPNKVGIQYSPTQFDVMYRGVPLGRASIPGFDQPAHSVRQVQTTISVDRVNLLQAEATDLVKDATLYDRVELRITGDVGAKIRLLGITSPKVKVSVDCAIVISPRKSSLTYKQCGVDGLNV